ncbi:MAG: cupredoxin domain-containing protein [Ginsengibacter sp.]
MKTKKWISAFISGFIIMVAFYACSKSNDKPPVAGGNEKTIVISNMAFPATTTVAKGTTVIWKNQDSFAHTVTSDDGTAFSSGNVAAGASFTYVANVAGTIEYHCEYHGSMKGKLVVTQ